MGGLKLLKVSFWPILFLLLFLVFSGVVKAIPPYVLGPDDVIELYAVDSQKEDILDSPSHTNALYQTYEKFQVAILPKNG